MEGVLVIVFFLTGTATSSLHISPHTLNQVYTHLVKGIQKSGFWVGIVVLPTLGLGE